MLTFTVSTPRAKYPDGRASTRFLEDAVVRLRGLPGVESASGAAFLPFSGLAIGTDFWIPTRPEPAAGLRPGTEVRPIDDEYFRALRIPIRRGRFFSHDEVVNGAHVAIVNDTMVRRMFVGEDPIGQPILVNLGDTAPDEIVGVVADVKVDGLQATTDPIVYYPYGHTPVGAMTFVLRSGVDAGALLRAATAVIQEQDKDLPLTGPKLLSDVVSDSVASPAVAALLISLFAALALGLSLIGTGALLAASVSARRQEFSVRLALGATRGMIRRLVLSEGGRLVVAGLVLGMAAAVSLSRLASGLLFEVQPTDPATYALTVAVVLVLMIVASDIPARRATRIEPADMLK
jgi:predicted permease